MSAWEDGMAKPEDISIQLIDRTDNGMIVHFSNGESVLYHATFLYDVRHHDGNRPLPAGTEEDE